MSEEQEAAVDIRVLGGGPDAEELAAVTAVLSAALAQLAHEARLRRERRPSRWELGRRGLRTPLPRDWRSGA